MKRFTKQALVEELMWEYGYTTEEAEKTVKDYQSKGLYDTLCCLITIRQSLAFKKGSEK